MQIFKVEAELTKQIFPFAVFMCAEENITAKVIKVFYKPVFKKITIYYGCKKNAVSAVGWS